MGLASAINVNGSVPTVVGPIYQVDNDNIHVIKNIKFNNADPGTAYTIQLYKLVEGDEAPTLLYNLSLDAGDYVDDDDGYELTSGVSLQASSNVDTVVFSITGIEQYAQ